MRVIDDANRWHKLASIRVAAVIGAITAYLAANPAETQKLLNYLPEGPMRDLAAIGIGISVFSTYAGARLVTTEEKPVMMEAEDVG